jgi:hypothetical protein
MDGAPHLYRLLPFGVCPALHSNEITECSLPNKKSIKNQTKQQMGR